MTGGGGSIATSPRLRFHGAIARDGAGGAVSPVACAPPSASTRKMWRSGTALGSRHRPAAACPASLGAGTTAPAAAAAAAAALAVAAAAPSGGTVARLRGDGVVFVLILVGVIVGAPGRTATAATGAAALAATSAPRPPTAAAAAAAAAAFFSSLARPRRRWRGRGRGGAAASGTGCGGGAAAARAPTRSPESFSPGSIPRRLPRAAGLPRADSLPRRAEVVRPRATRRAAARRSRRRPSGRSSWARLFFAATSSVVEMPMRGPAAEALLGLLGQLAQFFFLLGRRESRLRPRPPRRRFLPPRPSPIAVAASTGLRGSARMSLPSTSRILILIVLPAALAAFSTSIRRPATIAAAEVGVGQPQREQFDFELVADADRRERRAACRRPR